MSPPGPSASPRPAHSANPRRMMRCEHPRVTIRPYALPCTNAAKAFGIDGCAHRAALAVHGITVAVLASGVDRDYPLGHCELFRSIREQGALVSEWPPGRMPTKPSFLVRNRVIVASLGYKTDVPCLINGRSWSAARVLSRRCATPVVGPGGSAISRNRPRWHRVGLKPGIGSWPLWRRGDVGHVEQAVDRASSRVLAGAGVRLCARGRAWASVLSLRHPSRG
jgi:hypothetical protein